MITELQEGWATRGTAFVPPSRRFDILEEDLDDEAILVDPGNGNSHRLNETAIAVWKWCDGASSTQEIAGRLAESYEVDADTAIDYVHQLVARFAQLQLLDLTVDP